MQEICKNCETSEEQTIKMRKWLSQQQNKREFWEKRMDFVYETLKEFGDLQPSALEIIFDYKDDNFRK